MTAHRLRNAVRITVCMRPGAQRIAQAFTHAGGARAAADAVEELLPTIDGSRYPESTSTGTNAGQPG